MAGTRTETALQAGTPGGPGEWWRRGVLYEAYVRSFRYSNRDGECDRRGLIAGLDFLTSLGIDAVWLTPISPSPNFDSGHHVSDHMGIKPAFGTMDNFRNLVEGAHARGRSIVLGQVYSHSSHLHPWFVESAASRNNPRADWYVWADPLPDGGPSNNWLGRFGGYAWEWNSTRRQYCLHNFLIEQPDLNHYIPEVQEAMLAIMRHWFDLGVDGLRLEVVNFHMQDPALRDNPPSHPNAPPANPYYLQSLVHDRARPENLLFMALRRSLPALRRGVFEVLAATPDRLMFCRRLGAEALTRAFNFGSRLLALAARGVPLTGVTEVGALPPDGYVILREAP